jgi:hypothetical protein
MKKPAILCNGGSVAETLPNPAELAEWYFQQLLL